MFTFKKANTIAETKETSGNTSPKKGKNRPLQHESAAFFTENKLTKETIIEIEKKLNRMQIRLQFYKRLRDNPIIYDLLVMQDIPKNIECTNSAFLLIQPRPSEAPTSLYFINSLADTPTLSHITFPAGKDISTFTKALYPGVQKHAYTNIRNLSSEQFQLAAFISGEHHPANVNAVKNFEDLCIVYEKYLKEIEKLGYKGAPKIETVLKNPTEGLAY